MKTSEMIAMLEKDPTLKFKSANKFFRLSDVQNSLYGWADENSEGTWNFNIKDEWELVSEPVPVWEAVKALKEGQTVTVKWLGYNSVINPIVNFTLSTNKILNGTWYIGEVS